MITLIILYEDICMIREIKEIERILYGDPMNRLRLVIALGLLALIEAIFLLIIQLLKYFP